MHLSEQPDHQVRMTTYVSRFASADEEWPHAWTLVEVRPSQWSCTVPVLELVNTVLTHSAEAELRGIPHEWRGGELALDLGPAAISGTTQDWLALCRRLIDASQSAEGVSELPGAQPWSGPRSAVAMEAIVVVGETPPAPASLSPIETLATAGGFETREFVELFGNGWVEWDIPPAGDAIRLNDLFLWGTPFQLGATGNVLARHLEIGIPRGRWCGAGRLDFELAEATPVSRALTDDEIRGIVKPLLARRRRSFNWCHYCGERIAPEQRFEPTVCYGCATDIYGMIY